MLLLKEKAKEMVRERVALRKEREELRGNNKRLFGELERRKSVEVPVTAKRYNLEAGIVMVDAGALKEGVAQLVALERELREEAARLSR